MDSVTITYLEMKSADQLRPKCVNDPRFRVMEASVKQWELNRFLYELVGRDWNWRDKLPWSESQWRSYVESDDLRTFVAYYDGSPAGYYELRTTGGEIEIAYFGLSPKFIGQGFGGALLTNAIEEAWRMHPSRVWLHTCTLDHPSALKNYLARGMTVYNVET
jgi:ribosomal protein S18 acetylase RimI-like enzyme